MSSDREIYERVCQGDAEAVKYYLRTADPEDANHGVLEYVERLQKRIEKLESDAQYVLDTVHGEFVNEAGEIKADANVIALEILADTLKVST